MFADLVQQVYQKHQIMFAAKVFLHCKKIWQFQVNNLLFPKDNQMLFVIAPFITPSASINFQSFATQLRIEN